MAEMIYIGGPYTKPDPAVNVARAMEVFNELVSYGYTPILPHFCHFSHMQNPRNYEDWLCLDFRWLERCEVMLRIPGESSGADREEAHAKINKIPVVRDIDELLRQFPPAQKPENYWEIINTPGAIRNCRQIYERFQIPE